MCRRFFDTPYRHSANAHAFARLLRARDWLGTAEPKIKTSLLVEVVARVSSHCTWGVAHVMASIDPPMRLEHLASRGPLRLSSGSGMANHSMAKGEVRR